ncbi:MAG: hypothetical protein ACREFP_14455 [Acetobacteraceae bacterium]
MDLLIVDGNPLEQIEVLAAGGHHLTHVMVDGALVKRPEACAALTSAGAS